MSLTLDDPLFENIDDVRLGGGAFPQVSKARREFFACFAFAASPKISPYTRLLALNTALHIVRFHVESFTYLPALGVTEDITSQLRSLKLQLR